MKSSSHSRVQPSSGTQISQLEPAHARKGERVWPPQKSPPHSSVAGKKGKGRFKRKWEKELGLCRLVEVTAPMGCTLRRGLSSSQLPGVTSVARAALPARDDGSDLCLVLDSYLRDVSSDRFGRSMLPTIRTLRGSPEHAPSSQSLETRLDHSQKPTEF